jgi:thiol-disulfide isomerase/thioredoxin
MLAALRGRVVLIDFWTYSCINCIRTLPYLRACDAHYRDAGLTIVGIHAPEFSFERDAGNLRRAVRSNRLRYLVAQDNEFATWRAYGNQFWPAKYLIDARGRVRYTHFGEGDYGKTESAIRPLLAEARERRLGSTVRARTESALAGATPESYLGAERAERIVNGHLREGAARFQLPAGGVSAIPLHHLALEGRWRVRADRAISAGVGARVHLCFAARRVFLVLGSPQRAQRVSVRLDGRPRRAVRARAHRLYELVRLARPGAHLTLDLPPGTEVYAFTFG